ncbi:hypothetical protein ART_1263 [Arthrobacter sp. PAMC 25486]|uniref:bifunctional glycosyltransferase/CDP-glycerol:glycerophosphate glycerophosphotransferase n=1 Tax=Arthrobacter sp. PAMC 25486 TaxID=1494608 RepID=UPI000535E211|nr:CDP-glycerol glycerophosphotransferase family protein [Arthrobacter sp. PAMC 25486]AIY00862.1 hypothetical protein ART_1263 [Arthrobacter sp. PAMC 25486]
MSTLRNVAAKVLPQKYKDKLRHAVHPAQRLGIARMLGKGEPNVGLLSVVIPVYNVAQYVAECLTSVISQSYSNLQIIVVDDGSTDESMQIVAEFAKYDKRISIINLENGGNGRARNIGISAAKGEYLTFADSDDVVAHGAYSLMMATISQSHSDFVVGSYARIIGNKLQKTKASSHMHADKRVGICIDEFPDILDDVFFWNKVFRKSFWDTKVAPIPEGVLYEDQETTARAFIRATSFDVLEEVVYFWRQRSDGSSITQGKRSQKDLDDRMLVAHHVSSLLASESSQRVLHTWFARLLGSDLVPYYEQVPYTNDLYWSALHQGTKSLSKVIADNFDSVEHLNLRVDPHARVLLRFATAGMKVELEQVIVDRMESGRGFQIDVRDGLFYATPSYARVFPEYANSNSLQCDASLLQIDTKLAVTGWADNGDLMLSGYGFVRGLSDESVEVAVRVGIGAEDWQELRLKRTTDDHLDARVNDAFASHRSSTFTVRVPAAVLASVDDGMLRATVSLTVVGHTSDLAHALQVPTRSLMRYGSTPQVCDFAVLNDSEELSVDIDWGGGRPAFELYLATQQRRLVPVQITNLGENTVRYVFRLAEVVWGRTVYSPPPGAYTLRFHANAGSAATSKGRTLGVAEELSWKLPLEFQMTHCHVQAWRTRSGNLAVTLGAPLGIDERGKFWQRSLQHVFSSEPAELQEHFVFESFGGKSCTDSPKALSDELYSRNHDAIIYWSIDDFSVSYPDYARPLVRGTRKWFEKVSTAKYLINNNNFPFYFRKSIGQFYLQTWHGTPMKKIGLDAPTRYISPSYRQLMEREASYWDLLLAQNDFSREVLPQAFGYSGRVLTAGYPRNDTLASQVSNEKAREVRGLLGIREDQTAILYAPTWRDTAKNSGGVHQWVGHIDFDQAFRSLGEKTVFLMRGHHNVLGGRVSKFGDNVIDVSGYPEINDLILASDALVTDYSSIVFDYSLTGRNIYFLVTDINEYENDMRGLYLSHADLGLGGLFNNGSDLIKFLAKVVKSAQQINISGKKFTAYDDGSASVRVLESIAEINSG